MIKRTKEAFRALQKRNTPFDKGQALVDRVDVLGRELSVRLEGSEQILRCKVPDSVDINIFQVRDAVLIQRVRGTFYVVERLIPHLDKGTADGAVSTATRASGPSVPPIPASPVPAASFGAHLNSGPDLIEVLYAEDEDGTNARVVATGSGLVSLPPPAAADTHLTVRRLVDGKWVDQGYEAFEGPLTGQIPELPAPGSLLTAFTMRGHRVFDDDWLDLLPAAYWVGSVTGELVQAEKVDWSDYDSFQADYTIRTDGADQAYTDVSLTLVRRVRSIADEAGVINLDLRKNLKVKTSELAEGAVLAEVAPAQLTGNVNNYNPGSGQFVRIDANGDWTITGWVAPAVSGTLTVAYNISAYTLTFAYQSGSSSAANRFLFSNGDLLTINAGSFLRLLYDGTTQRWRNI